jgi:hypothetical protein
MGFLTKCILRGCRSGLVLRAYLWWVVWLFLLESVPWWVRRYSSVFMFAV